MISGNIRLLRKEKVYFEFEAEIQGKQTHFLIEVDKETEDPE